MEYNLKRDVDFKTFFSRKEKYLKSFLEALLDMEIYKIEINQEVHVEKLLKEEKGGSMDLQAEINEDTIVNIEMQRKNYQNIEQRSTYYSSRIISRSLRAGMDYTKIKKVIMINILDYILYKEHDEYISKTAIVLDKHRNHEVIREMQWYFIEIPKIRKLADIDLDNIVNQWLIFIDNKNRRLVKMVKERNKIFKEAEEDLKYLTGEEEERRLQDLREKWEFDRISETNYAREEGEKIGERRGMEIGEKRGMEIGEKRGMKIGEKRGMEIGEKNIIKTLLKNNMSPKEIAEKTGIALGKILRIIN